MKTYFSLLLKFKVCNVFPERKITRRQVAWETKTESRYCCWGWMCWTLRPWRRTFLRRAPRLCRTQRWSSLHKNALVGGCTTNTHTATRSLTLNPRLNGYEYCIALEHEKSIMTTYSSIFLVFISASCKDGMFCSLYISLMCLWLFSFHSCHVLIN